MDAKQNKYSHALWDTINRIAEQQGQSCSGLAISCGLDSTAFNKCKRQSKYGQPRWLPSETIAKILSGTNMTLTQFTQIMESMIHESENATH